MTKSEIKKIESDIKGLLPMLTREQQIELLDKAIECCDKILGGGTWR